MAEYERIINKLNTYLVNNMGFKKNGMGYSKILKDEADIGLSDQKVSMIASGNLFGGRKESYYETIEEDYIVERIEERYDEFLILTNKERAWLSSYDEDGIYGADAISEYIWDYLDVSVNRKMADKYMEKVVKKAA